MIAAVVTVVALAAGCSSGGSDKSAAPAATTTPVVDTLAPPTVENAPSATIRVIDNDFTPKHLQVRKGTKVTFLEAGHNQHNVIPDDPAAMNFSIPETELTLGSRHTFSFDKPGTYPYYCSLHATPTAGTMRGVITVTR